MKQKTAIQQLFESYGHLLPDVENEYLDKEKEQIAQAFNHGYGYGVNWTDASSLDNGYNYFTRTFEQTINP